jgi:hypothetical protein
MNRIAFVWIFLLTISSKDCLLSIGNHESVTFNLNRSEQDTLKENQNLYTGKVWKNNFHRINGDQFLFTNYFLPGSVSTNGKTFKNLSIRYDIYSDEIMIPVDFEEIVQLNKEMIDSFSITFENKIYRFSKIAEDSLNSIKGLKGYLYVLYQGASALYIKYGKYILPNITDKSDGDFIQTHKIYLVKDKIVNEISTKNDLYKVLDADKVHIKDYLKNNKIKVSKNRPESFVPVIRFYDSISH